jgi:hypothetical protein
MGCATVIIFAVVISQRVFMCEMECDTLPHLRVILRTAVKFLRTVLFTVQVH